MKQVITTFRTAFANSPVIEVKSKKYGDGSHSTHYLCITPDGDIYRACRWNEIPETCGPIEVTLSQSTIDMIAGYESEFSGTSGSGNSMALRQRIEIQRMLQDGAGYVSYNVHHEPLHTINPDRYYDVLANSQRLREIKECKSVNAELRNTIATLSKMVMRPLAKYRNVTLQGKIAEFLRKTKSK